MWAKPLVYLCGLFLVGCQSGGSSTASPEMTESETSATVGSTRATTSVTTTAAPTTTTLVAPSTTSTLEPPPPDTARFAPIGESIARNSEGPPTTPQPPAPADFTPAMGAVTAERLGLSWSPECPVTPDQLRMVTIRYHDCGGVARMGELIVHERIASKVMTAFEDLFRLGFPINRVETPERFARPEDFGPDRVFVEHHGAADLVNDTSGFFCRRATGSSSWSQHALGLAIDINPVQNPYINRGTVIPSNGTYAPDAPGTIRADSDVVDALATAGLQWGGDWGSLKDYMHFSLSGR